MIFFKRVNSYDLKILEKIFEECFNFFKIKLLNQKILLKPNLVSPKPAEKHATTYYKFVESLIIYLTNFNNKIFIGDSPAISPFSLVLKASSYSALEKKYGIKFYPFNKKILLSNPQNKILKKFYVSTAIEQFDSIINLPKLKTHCMTDLTLSTKNLFGFIVGTQKSKYHLKAGKNKEYFADILIDISETLKKYITLHIIDGIIGMEGNGPTNGENIKLNIFAASKNPYILDYFIEKSINFPYESLITKQLKKRELLETQICINNKINNKVTQFKNISIKPPKTKNTDFGIPDFLLNFIMPKPKIENHLCQKCLECQRICPPKAIFLEKNRVKIDYDKCIKCFCCQEVCQFNAIKIKKFIIF